MIAARPARGLAVATLALSVLYLTWRLTTLGSGWLLVVAVPLLIAEITAAGHLGLLVFQTWTPPAHPPADTGARGTVEVVIDASGADLAAVETTLVGCRSLDSPADVHIVDDRHRAPLHRLAHDRGLGYTSAASGIHGLADRLAATDADLVVVLDAGAVPMPALVHHVAPHFDDPTVAVVQVAIDLLNADSLAHLTRGRDEQALERDVIGPSTGARGLGPWAGTGSVVRPAALADIGGVDPCDASPLHQALVRLHRAGWTSTYDARPLVRAPAPDGLDEYLAIRRQRTLRGLCLLGSADGPTTSSSLPLTARLAHLARALAPGAGLRQLLYVTVLAITLLTGRLPFTADIALIASAWAAVAGTQALTRHHLAAGTMARGDWLRQGWRTLGADAEALARRLGIGRPGRRSDRGPGWGSLGHLQLLTGAVVVLEVAVLARAYTLVDADFLPAFTDLERVVVLAVGLGLLIPMVDVLQLHVRRTQRRRDPRRVAHLPVVIAGAHTTTLDITPRGLGVAVDQAPPIGTEVDIELELPRPDGPAVSVTSGAIVRAATARPEGDVRLGLELTGTTDADRAALIRYCAIDHAVLADAARRLPRRCPGDLEVVQSDGGRSALRVLTAAAMVLGVVTLGLGPAATVAGAAEVKAAVCLSDSRGAPFAGADTARQAGGTWVPLGPTGADGCITAAVPEGTDTFRVSYEGRSVVRTQDPVNDPIVRVSTEAFTVAVRRTDGAPVVGASVRRWIDGWVAMGDTGPDGRVSVEQLPGDVEIEVTDQGIRFVESRPADADPTVVITMARLVADDGVSVEALDGGAGWRPFSPGMEVLPGRYSFRLGGAGVAKLEVPGRYEVAIPSGELTELIPEVVAAAPSSTVAPTTTGAPTTTVPTTIPTTAPPVTDAPTSTGPAATDAPTTTAPATTTVPATTVPS